MKLKSFFAVAAIVLFTACETPYRAADTSIVVPPESAQASFDAKYPDAVNIIWTHYDPGETVPIDWELAGWGTMDPSGYLVRFDVDNENYYSWYDDNGDWVGTAYVVKDYRSLPTEVNDVIGKQYPDYSIVSVNREFHEDKMAYEVILKNTDTKVKLLVDGNGVILKERVRSLD